MIRGNHDKVAAGLDDGESFNRRAQRRPVDDGRADAGEPRYLRDAAGGPTAVDDHVQICHGSPFDEDAYIFDELDACGLRAATRPVCLFGHTHVAVVFTRTREGLDVETPDGEPLWPVTIVDDRRYLINPGSVGQPRDGDPRCGVRDRRHDRTTRGTSPDRLPDPGHTAESVTGGPP